MARNFGFSGHLWRFQTSIRAAISMLRAPIPCPAGAENWLRRGREFSSSAQGLTRQGREFAISVNSRLKIRHSRSIGRRRVAVAYHLACAASCAFLRSHRAGGRSAGCIFAVPNSSRGIDGPTATRLVPVLDGRSLIGRERLLRTRPSGGSMRGDQEMRQRRDRARHRPRLQCQRRPHSRLTN